MPEPEIQITGPKQKRPQDWRKSLKSSLFKSSLFTFLFDDWVNESYVSILENHVIYLTTKNECFQFRVDGRRIIRERIFSLECTHIEADTRIIFHLIHSLRENPKATISVRANDTDIFLLLVFHVKQHQLMHNTLPIVWVDAGLSSDNTRRNVSISELVSKVDAHVISALPGLHAMTGTDYTPSFNHKGKVRPFTIMCKNKDLCDAFSQLGESDINIQIVTKKLEGWVCEIYGKPKLNSVNKARLAMFEQKYKPKNRGDFLEMVKGANPSLFPPCSASLKNQVLRAHLVSSLWKNSGKPMPLKLVPEENGWKMVNGQYWMNWYDCTQLPNSLSDCLLKNPLDNGIDSDEEINFGDNIYGRDASSDEDSDADW